MSSTELVDKKVFFNYSSGEVDSLIMSINNVKRNKTNVMGCRRIEISDVGHIEKLSTDKILYTQASGKVYMIYEFYVLRKNGVVLENMGLYLGNDTRIFQGNPALGIHIGGFEKPTDFYCRDDEMPEKMFDKLKRLHESHIIQSHVVDFLAIKGLSKEDTTVSDITFLLNNHPTKLI